MHGFMDESGSFPESSEDAHAERARWLIGAGASRLIRNKSEQNVLDTVRGKTPRFSGIFVEAIRDENWKRRRGLLLLRNVLLIGTGCAKRVRGSVNDGDVIVLAATTCDDVFRKIVSFI